MTRNSESPHAETDDGDEPVDDIYRWIVDSAQEYAIFTLDLNGRITTWNRGAERIIGYTRDEAIGAPAHIAFTESDRQHSIPEREMAIALERGRASDERWHLRKDGSQFFASGLMMQLCAPDGRVIGLTKVLRDRTRQRELEQVLREREEILRLAIEAAALGTFDYYPQTGTLNWSPRCKALFGLPPEAPVDYELFVRALHPDDRARIVASVEETLAAPDTPFDVEYRTIGVADGVVRWLHAIGATRFEQDTPVRFTGIVLDGGDRKRLEQLLQERVEHQQMLIREVSHRVKNSLQMVSSLLVTQANMSSDADVRRALTDAQNRITTVAKVHDRLWSMNEVRQIDLGAFLGDFSRDLAESAPDCRIQFQSPPTPVPISTDLALRIALMVNELLTNAMKYAYPNSAGPVELHLASGSPEWLRIEVCDRGVGMPAGIDPSTTRSLGLRLVSVLARSLGGTLTLHDAQPGTRFEFTISQKPADETVP